MPAGRPSVRSPADHLEDFQGCFHGALTIVRNPFLSVGKAWTRKFLTTYFPGIPVARVAPSGTKGEMIDFINSRAAVALPCRMCALCKAGQSLPPMEHETPMEHEMLPGAPVFDGAAPVAASLFGGAGTAAVLQGGIELPVELGVQPGLDSGSLSVSPLASMLGTPELNMLAEAASSGLPPSQGFVLPESRPEPPAGGILAGLVEGGPITVAPFKHVAQQAATVSRGARIFESLVVHREVVERATMGTDHGGGYLAAASAGIKACPQAMWDTGGPLHTTLFNPLFRPPNRFGTISNPQVARIDPSHVPADFYVYGEFREIRGKFSQVRKSLDHASSGKPKDDAVIWSACKAMPLLFYWVKASYEPDLDWLTSSLHVITGINTIETIPGQALSRPASQLALNASPPLLLPPHPGAASSSLSLVPYAGGQPSGGAAGASSGLWSGVPTADRGGNDLLRPDAPLQFGAASHVRNRSKKARLAEAATDAAANEARIMSLCQRTSLTAIIANLTTALSNAPEDSKPMLLSELQSAQAELTSLGGN